jgi:hypothetical protein
MPAPEPVHPGAVLRECFLEPLGLTSNQVARAIGVLPEAVRRIAQEEMHLSAARRGVKLSSEQCAKMGRGRIGRKHTLETREFIVAAVRKARGLPPKVFQGVVHS